MTISLKSFTGEFPRTDVALLPDNAAQHAMNCDFLSGTLRGLRNDSSVIGMSATSTIKSMFVYEGGASAGYAHWWTRDVDAVRSPVVSDAYARFYWADGTNFYVSRGDLGGSGEPSMENRYKVGVPRPSAALALSSNVVALVGVASYSFSVSDERADGKLVNTVSVSATPAASATTITATFTARAPQPTTSDPETPLEETFIGTVVTLVMTRDDGARLTASIRTDSNKTSWPLELPGFSAAVTISGTSYTVRIAVSESYKELRAYTYTYVNQYGEEGVPADPLEVDCGEQATITITYTLPPSGYCPVSKVRIYRTATGTSTDYLLVSEVIVNGFSATFTDNIKTESLGEAISTLNYYPPDQTLKGICTMTNGILVGFKGNELWFSEPYLPYAWNPNAIKPLPNSIIGVCPFEGGLYVTTTANPYIIMGARPDSMTDAKLPAIQGGVSQRSIVNTGNYIAYVSRDGIVMAQGSQASLDKSFQFFTRQDWRALIGNNMANLRLAAHDGSLLIYFDNGYAFTDGTRGYLMRFEEEASSLVRINTAYYASFVYPLTDMLYMSLGTTVTAFREGNGNTGFTWQSKDFRMAKPLNFGAVQFNGTGSITLDVYADGVLKHTVAVTLSRDGRSVVRLPGGFLASVWSFKITGVADAEVEQMIVAQSLRELQGV